MQNEESVALNEAQLEFHAAEASKRTSQNDARRAQAMTEKAHQYLIDQLGKEEECRSVAVQRMEEAELRPRQSEFGGRQSLPALQEELMEGVATTSEASATCKSKKRT